MTYNKLVRDKIPEMIMTQGKMCRFEESEWPKEVISRKLDEEVKEFHNSIYVNSSLEELADIIEVCYAYAKTLDCTEEKLNEIRLKKREEKGGFDKNLFLFEVED